MQTLFWLWAEQQSAGLKGAFLLGQIHCLESTAAAAAAPIIAEFIAARSKWVSRRKSRRNRKCINLLFAGFVGRIKASIIPVGTQYGDEHGKSSWISHTGVLVGWRRQRIFAGSLSPGCPVAWVSLRAALSPCCLARPAAGPGPILIPSSQDVALSPCKIRALFCKVQRVRSKIYILNKPQEIWRYWLIFGKQS